MEIKGRKFANKRLGFGLTVYEIEGKEWFIGNEIAKLLEYSNYQKALQTHVSKKSKKSMYVKTIENIENTPHKGIPITINNNMLFISESGLYQLILKSSMPKAIEFQEWICEDILPSLRQNNFYVDKENINKSQVEELKEYLFDLCESGKISLGKASKMLFGNESELKKRFVKLGWLDYENCRFTQKTFTASNEKVYELFVCNMSGTYDEGITKHQLQVSLTNAGYIWIKNKIEKENDLGL